MSGKSLGEVMKRMEDIREEILNSYLPEFLDQRMLHFVELKYKLETELEQRTGFKRKNTGTWGKRPKRVKKGLFDHIDREITSLDYWSHNVSHKNMVANQAKQKVKGEV